MNSSTMNSSSVSYQTQTIPVGYVFKPNEDEIYSYFIPTRISTRSPILEVEEIDIYGDKSPDELFGKRDLRKHIYLFTRLKKEKETHTRIKRTGGGGTWLGQKPTPCYRVLDGEEIIIGTMRQFTYTCGEDRWVMHEYCIEDEFLNYRINRRIKNPNPENIVFCHIYNKKAKKRKRDDSDNDEEENNEENVDGIINNNVSSLVYPNNVPQPLLPEPQPEGEFNQEFMMENYDNMSLPDQKDEVIKNFLNDCGNGSDQEFMVQEPVYYYPSTTETYNEVGDDWFSLADLFLNNY